MAGATFREQPVEQGAAVDGMRWGEVKQRSNRLRTTAESRLSNIQRAVSLQPFGF